jgi:hypothetical protein
MIWPPITHGDVREAVTNLQARTYRVDDYGADPTGVVDSTAAFVAAQTAAGTGPYLLELSSGSYLLGTSGDLNTFGLGQGMIGQGSMLTTLNYAGSGACVKAYNPTFSNSGYGGRFGGFSIRGNSAGSGAVGMWWGNMQGARCHDISISSFASATGVGLQLKNGPTSAWSEQGVWTGIRLASNTVNVLFDSGSFDYSIYEFVVFATANQDGIRLQSDAALEGVRLELRGNFFTGATNTGAVIAIDRGNATGTSRIDNGQLFVNVECDGSSGVGHVTVLQNGGSASQFTGTGVLQFLDGTMPFAGAVNTGGAQFGVSGVVRDPILGKSANGDALAVQGGSNWAQAGSFTTQNGAQLFLKNGDLQACQLSSGANALSFNSFGTGRARRVELFVVQPAGGAAGTITWPSNVYFPGGAPTLSTPNGAVDKIVLTYLPSENKWLGQFSGGYVAATSLVAPPAYQPYLGTEGEAIAVGEETQPRRSGNGQLTIVSGTLYLSFFTSRKAETKTRIAAFSNATAAAATPTYAAMGIYSLGATGTLTLLGQSASDTTLLNTTFAVNERTLTSSVTTVVGQRYAFGLLVVSAAAMPSVYATTSFALNYSSPPFIGASVTGQSSLPASIASGAYAAANNQVYGLMRP